MRGCREVMRTSESEHYPGFLTGSRDHGAEIWPASGFEPRRQYRTYWQGAKKRWRDKDQARARRDCEKSGLGASRVDRAAGRVTPSRNATAPHIRTNRQL